MLAERIGGQQTNATLKGVTKMKNRIRELRELRGLRQTDVAFRFDPPKDPARISMWESGKEAPRVDHLFQLARILGCGIEELFEEKVGGEA